MLITKMVPLDTVLKDVYLLTRERDVQEDLVMEFAIRAMEHMGTFKFYEKAVCYVKIENHQGNFPSGMLGIHGVLYSTGNRPQMLTQYVTTHTDGNGDDDLSKEDRVQGYLDPNRNVLVWKVNNFFPVDIPQSSGWAYLPVSNNIWDRSIICNQEPVKVSCGDWYVPDTSNARFLTSFESGWLAVAYFRLPMDNEGRFLIPDIPEYHEAIESYVFSKIYQRQWHMNVQASEGKYQHYLQKWQQLAAAAVARMMMLSLPEWINVDKQNKFFRDDSPTKVFGGMGKERMNYERSPYPGRRTNF